MVAVLSNIGYGRGATFDLFKVGMQNTSRGDVEDWIGRKEAEAKALEAKRFRYILVASVVAVAAAVLAVVAGIVAAWPVVHEWIK